MQLDLTTGGGSPYSDWLRVPDGTPNQPGLQFGTTGLGFYKVDNGDLGLAYNGQLVMTLGVGGLNGALVTNVRSFGAKGNGAHDDTAAINAALVAGAGGAVYVPPGAYIISAPLTVPSNTIFFGDGFASQIIKSAAWLISTPLRMVQNGDRRAGSSDTNITIQGLNVITDNLSDIGLGIQNITFYGSTKTRVYDCFTSGGAPVSIIQCQDFVLSRMRCDMAVGAISPWSGAQQVSISNIVYYNDPVNFNGNVIAINADDSFNTGVNLVVSDIEVSNVRFYGSTGVNAAIELFPLASNRGNIIRNVRISDCYINGLGTSAQSGIMIGGNCQNIVVDNVIVEGFTSVSAVQLLNEDTTFWPANVTITNVMTRNCNSGGYPLYLLTGTGVTVANCSDQGSTYPSAFGNFANEVAVNISVINNRIFGAGSTRYTFASGASTLSIVEPQGARNSISLTGGDAVSSNVNITTSGIDSAVSLLVSTQGSSYINLQPGGTLVMQLGPSLGAPDFIFAQGGNGVVGFSAVGASTNVSFTLTPKGTGVVDLGTKVKATLGNYANDAAAAAGGVGIGGFYRNASAMQVRVT